MSLFRRSGCREHLDTLLRGVIIFVGTWAASPQTIGATREVAPMPPPSGWYKEFMATAGVNVGSHKPSPIRYTGPPMDLANMRANGVRSIYVWCLDCGHAATVNLDDQPGHLAVPSFARRMKCECGSRNVSVRPAWLTRPKWVQQP